MVYQDGLFHLSINYCVSIYLKMRPDEKYQFQCKVLLTLTVAVLLHLMTYR